MPAFRTCLAPCHTPGLEGGTVRVDDRGSFDEKLDVFPVAVPATKRSCSAGVLAKPEMIDAHREERLCELAGHVLRLGSRVNRILAIGERPSLASRSGDFAQQEELAVMVEPK